MKNLSIIIREIQLIQNEYQRLKIEKDPLGMLCVMWDIGDYLIKQGVKNPHSLGWEIQKKKAYIKRPMIFRSVVIRRIWSSKEKLKKDLYGVRSLNSVIELFPFIDQNSKWKLPKEKLDHLFRMINTIIRFVINGGYQPVRHFLLLPSLKLLDGLSIFVLLFNS